MATSLLSREEVFSYIRDRVNQVSDPCSQALGVAIGLCDMGLVRSLEAEPLGDRWSVRLTLRLTSPGCLYFVYFEESIRQRIDHPAIGNLEIDFDSGLDWTPEAMAPAAQRRLAARRSRLLHLHSCDDDARQSPREQKTRPLSSQRAPTA